MLNNFFRDSIANASSEIIGASLPLMVMGMIGHPALLISAGSVGGVSLFVFIIRMIIVMRKGGTKIPLLDNIMGGLFFPYCFALSFSIGIAYGEKAGWFGIWFALALAVLAVISSIVAHRKGIDLD